MLLVVGAIVEADAGRAPTFAMASHARADTWLALRRPEHLQFVFF